MDFKEFLEECKTICTDETCPMKQELDWLTENVDTLPDKIEAFFTPTKSIVTKLCRVIPIVDILMRTDEIAGMRIVHAVRDAIVYGYARGRREQIEIDRIERLVDSESQ